MEPMKITISMPSHPDYEPMDIEIPYGWERVTEGPMELDFMYLYGGIRETLKTRTITWGYAYESDNVRRDCDTDRLITDEMVILRPGTKHCPNCGILFAWDPDEEDDYCSILCSLYEEPQEYAHELGHTSPGYYFDEDGAHRY